MARVSHTQHPISSRASRVIQKFILISLLHCCVFAFCCCRLNKMEVFMTDSNEISREEKLTILCRMFCRKKFFKSCSIVFLWRSCCSLRDINIIYHFMAGRTSLFQLFSDKYIIAAEQHHPPLSRWIVNFTCPVVSCV